MKQNLHTNIIEYSDDVCYPRVVAFDESGGRIDEKIVGDALNVAGGRMRKTVL